MMLCQLRKSQVEHTESRQQVAATAKHLPGAEEIKILFCLEACLVIFLRVFFRALIANHRMLLSLCYKVYTIFYISIYVCI